METNTDKQKKYTHSTKLAVVSFIVATGGIFFANPSVIAQSSPVQTTSSSRVLTKIKSQDLNWGYSNGNPPISDEKTSVEKPGGLCADLMGLLKNYLKTKNLVSNKFEIKPYSVRFEDRFKNTKLRGDSINSHPKYDIECGANTIRKDIPGIVFSKPFAHSKAKILIPKSKESLFKSALTGETTVKIGIIKNSTTKPKTSSFLADESPTPFSNKGEALDALKSGKIDGFVNDEILLKGILKQPPDGFNAKDYMIYDQSLGLEMYGLVMPADDEAWKNTINNFLDENKAEIDKLQKKYIDNYRDNWLNKWLIIILIVVLVFLGIGVIGVISWIKLGKGQRKGFEHGYALLIGVGKCANSELSLPVTVKDVKEIRKTLVNPRFCAYPDDENHIRLLHDEQATRENILNGLDWLKNQTKHNPDATVTVYYSGHGALKKSDNRYYLIQHDTNISRFEETALSAEDFNDKLRQIQAKRLLIIIDSCHAAGMATSKDDLEKQGQVPLLSKILSGFEEMAYPKSLVNSLGDGEGRVFFTSSKGSESSWIRPDQQMSIYTYHLIEALKGKANKRGDKCIKVSHLMTYLGEKVPESANNLCKAKQTPQFDFITEDFPIALLKREEKA